MTWKVRIMMWRPNVDDQWWLDVGEAQRERVVNWCIKRKYWNQTTLAHRERAGLCEAGLQGVHWGSTTKGMDGSVVNYLRSLIQLFRSWKLRTEGKLRLRIGELGLNEIMVEIWTLKFNVQVERWVTSQRERVFGRVNKKGQIQERKGNRQSPKPIHFFLLKHVSATHHSHDFFIKPLQFLDTTTH